MSRDSVGRTLLVAAGVALFCSLVVSSAVIYLRPVQLAWAQLGRNRLVLELAGRIEPAAELSDREVATRFRAIEAVLIDLESGAVERGREALSYDPRDAQVLSSDGVDIPAELDLARLGSRARLAPVYLYREDGGLNRVVLPLWGQGMWAPIEAFISLEGDCTTVSGLAIRQHGETPGVGDRIERPGWLASWVGLRATDGDGRLMLEARGSGRLSPSEEHEHAYDSISGATVTVTAVGRMVRYWLGEHGYGPFLERCRAGEAPWS